MSGQPNRDADERAALPAGLHCLCGHSKQRHETPGMGGECIGDPNGDEFEQPDEANQP